MIYKLARWKNLILIICIALSLVLWTLALIFGNRGDKITVLVLSSILPFVIYGAVRLMFKVIRIAAPLKFICFLLYFFVAMGTLGIAMSVFDFISSFPNGLSPTLTACSGIIVATLDEASRGKKDSR